MFRYHVTVLFCGVPVFFIIEKTRSEGALTYFDQCYIMLRDYGELDGVMACELLGEAAEAQAAVTTVSVFLGNHEIKFEEVPLGP